MRAKFINEIKRDNSQSGLGSIGIGNKAIQFGTELKKHPAILAWFSTLEIIKKDNIFFATLYKIITELLESNLKSIKYVNFRLPEELENKWNDIIKRDDTEEFVYYIPAEEIFQVADDQNDIEYITGEKTVDVRVVIKCNLNYGIADARYYLPIKDVEEIDNHEISLFVRMPN